MSDYYGTQVYFFFFVILVSLYGVISCDVINIKNFREILRYFFWVLVTPLILYCILLFNVPYCLSVFSDMVGEIADIDLNISFEKMVGMEFEFTANITNFPCYCKTNFLFYKAKSLIMILTFHILKLSGYHFNITFP